MASRATYASARPSREIAGPPLPARTWPGGQPDRAAASRPAAAVGRRREPSRGPTPRPPRPAASASASHAAGDRHEAAAGVLRCTRGAMRRAKSCRREPRRASPMSRRRCFASRSRQRRSRLARPRAGVSAGRAAQSGSRLEHRGERVADRLALEEPRPVEHLEEHDAEGPDVGALVDRLAAGLLGATCRPRCRG